MEDNSGPVSWQCGHVSAGTTGPLATGAHVVLISGALHWIITIITRGLQGYSIVTASWQHCYSLVTTCQCSGAVMQSVTSWHAHICTSGLQMEAGVSASGRKVNHLWRCPLVMDRVGANIQNGFQHRQRVMMWCGVEAVENIFIGSINLKFCFHPFPFVQPIVSYFMEAQSVCTRD